MRTRIVLSLLLFSSGVLAAPSEGETLFRDGRAAMEAKDYDRACTKFAESLKLEPAPGTALNLGECEERRGHLVAAGNAFTAAASSFTSADKQKYASSRADAVDKRTPRLTVHASSPAAGMTVTAGSEPLTIDTETKLDPGELVIHVEAPGYRPKDLKATLKESKSLEIDIGALERAESTSKPPPTIVVAEKKSSPLPLKTIGIVVAGAGAASLIVGGVTGILTLGHASTVEEHCDGALACDPEGLDAASSGSTMSTVSTFTFIGGAVAVAAGVVLYWLGPKKPAGVTTTALRF